MKKKSKEGLVRNHKNALWEDGKKRCRSKEDFKNSFFGRSLRLPNLLYAAYDAESLSPQRTASFFKFSKNFL